MKSVANLAEDREGQIPFAPLDSSEETPVQSTIPCKAVLAKPQGFAFGLNSCGPTLGVRHCHLPYLGSYLPHSLLRSETVDLAMSVAFRRLPSALILGASANSSHKEKLI